MIRLNRTTEYGLMALKHMSQKQTVATSHDAECGVTSAREISDAYGLPFEITAKTLQRLKDQGLIHSAQGAKGGYTLKRPLEQVTLAEFMELMEGRQGVVGCLSTPTVSETKATACEYDAKCEIRQIMGSLNSKVLGFLSGIKLAEITGSGTKPATRTVYEEPYAHG